MNILIITKNYSPLICGVGDHSFHLKQQMEAAGHQVFVLTQSGCTSTQESAIFFANYFDSRLCNTIQNILSSKCIDAIIWQYVPYSFQRSGLPIWWPKVMRQLTASRVKQFIFFHEVSLRYWVDGCKQTGIAYIQRRIARKANAIADASFTNTSLYRSYFRKAPPLVIPVGSNLSTRLGPISVKSRSVFCFANRVSEAVVRAISTLPGALQVVLVIGGQASGGQFLQIESWVIKSGKKQLFTVTGPLENNLLARAIAACEIVLLPQPVNKFGKGGVSTKNGTAMAAMQAGKAIISNAGDMTDTSFFRSNENIVFVPFDDCVAYQYAITQLFEKPDFCQALGKAAAQTYLASADWSIIGNRIESIINEHR